MCADVPLEEAVSQAVVGGVEVVHLREKGLASGGDAHYQSIYQRGVASVMSITPRPMALDVAIDNAYQLVSEATERALRMIALGMDMGQKHH